MFWAGQAMIIFGESLANVLEGGLGNDTLDGGLGNDTLILAVLAPRLASYGSATGGVTVNLGAGMSSGAAGTDSLTGIENVLGSNFADSILGDSLVNVLDGGDGSDTLNGGLGNDTLIGGAGTDLASYASATGGVTVNLGAGMSSGAAGTDSLTGIENVLGGNFADSILGEALPTCSMAAMAVTRLMAGLAMNTLDGDAGTDLVSYGSATGGVTVNLGAGTSSGAAGNRSLTGIEIVLGGNFADSILGDGLATSLDGGLGNDTLDGGGGDDWASYGSATARSLLTLARAAVPAMRAMDSLISIESVLGGAGNDYILGDSLNNTLNGGLGNDTLDGGAGTDLASYGSATGGVTVNLGAGTSSGAAGTGQPGGIEIVLGGNFADSILGDSLANVLEGGLGNDTLYGGAGNDTLIGGAGTDLAIYGSATGGVTVNLGAGTSSGAAGTDSLTGIETSLAAMAMTASWAIAWPMFLKAGLAMTRLMAALARIWPAMALPRAVSRSILARACRPARLALTA
jgi:Ca2+-binding RTX toxin-like protein